MSDQSVRPLFGGIMPLGVYSIASMAREYLEMLATKHRVAVDELDLAAVEDWQDDVWLWLCDEELDISDLSVLTKGLLLPPQLLAKLQRAAILERSGGGTVPVLTVDDLLMEMMFETITSIMASAASRTPPVTQSSPDGSIAGY